MNAIQFRKSIPRYVLQKLLGARSRRLARALSPISLVQPPPPILPDPSWVRVRPILSGICGSDLATICAKGSPYLAPMTSMPFVLGHETVGEVVETGSNVHRVAVGDRVVLHPALGCRVRGLSPACAACAAGHDALCRHITSGVISAGIQTGFCRDTGGAWSGGFVAHESQLYRVADHIPDQAAVLIEPFSCALHAVLRARPAEQDTVFVIGCGAIGLLTIAALRATGCRARILAAARYEHQAAHAIRLGATETIAARGGPKDYYPVWARRLGATVLEPELGKPPVLGGADVTFDCIASSSTIDDSIRFTRSGGTLVLVGMPGVPRGVDLTPLWYEELTIRAAYAYGPERWEGRVLDTFELSLELFEEWAPRLSPLVGRPHALADYQGAIAEALNTGRSGSIKTVFDPAL